MWFIGAEVEQETRAPPPLKKILDPPLDKMAYILVRIRAGTLHDVHHNEYESYFHVFLDITPS